VFTWLDVRGDEGLEYVRSHVGDNFHTITGCRYHPMFPVFKLAALRLSDSELLKRARRIASIKSFLIHKFTGTWIEDHGMASASGVFDIRDGKWAAQLLQILELDANQFPPIGAPADLAGAVTSAAAAEFGLSSGAPLIIGSGDGFLANLGSDCEVPAKIAVTLGTSGVARQTVSRPVTDLAAGTFCYRADQSRYLLGCAGSNGGNVLDWGRRIFGSFDNQSSSDPPIFIPLLHGERSPDWDPHLTGSWYGITALHTASDFSRSVLEGVIFNLAHFVDIVQTASAERATDLILSGNGFLHPAAAPMLAAVASVNTWAPRIPGFASLRGAGVCALRALGVAIPELEVALISPLADPNISKRYRDYRKLRSRWSGGL